MIMPFDAGPSQDPPERADPVHEPIDWLDYGLRLIVGLLLIFVGLLWMWSLARAAVYGFAGQS